MGLGKTCARPSVEGLGLGLGYVRYSSFGRKRIVISNDMDVDFIDKTPTKKQCNQSTRSSSDKSLLEALPQDILIRVLCGVDHDDLKKLFHVSKSVREATLVAKQLHFAYSTPTKRRLAFRSPIDLLDSNDCDETEAPNAPKQLRVPRSRIGPSYSSKDEEGWPKRQLFAEMEIEI